MVVIDAWQKGPDQWDVAYDFAEGSIVQIDVHPTAPLLERSTRGLIAGATEHGASFVQTVVDAPLDAVPRIRVSGDEAARIADRLEDQIDLWLDRQRTVAGDPLDQVTRERVKARALAIAGQSTFRAE